MACRRAWDFLRIVLPYILILSLIPTVAPLAFSATRFSRAQPTLVGPRAYYLALGDSLAFGYQPDFDWVDGYANAFFSDLKGRGVQHYDNLACPGESSSSMMNGGCPYAFLHKSLYSGSQLQAALNYLHAHAGQVSPVTLDIGVNDLIPDLNPTNCAINAKWQSDMVAVDNNLRNIILPQLVAALTVHGQMTGDLLLLNYYDPYQDRCPNTMQYLQTFNQDLGADASGYALPVDIWGSFANPITARAAAPVSNVCAYTWMCSAFKNIHPNTAGYDVMAHMIEHTVNY